jgi:hypothetical protein
MENRGMKSEQNDSINDNNAQFEKDSSPITRNSQYKLPIAKEKVPGSIYNKIPKFIRITAKQIPEIVENMECALTPLSDWFRNSRAVSYSFANGVNWSAKPNRNRIDLKPTPLLYYVGCKPYVFWYRPVRVVGMYQFCYTFCCSCENVMCLA